MDPHRLLVEQLRQLDLNLSADRIDRLLQLLEELLRWNRRHNLTAITDPAEGVEKHLVDSLSLLPLLEGNERMLDLGSGGGFPGLPLKIARPALQVLSVDAVAKKIAFQRHAVRLLGLGGFEPLHARAEDLASRAGCAAGFDLVVSRAFAALPVFAALALPFLHPSGRIVAMKGAEGAQELSAAEEALSALGLRCTETRQLSLPASGARRTLLILRRF